jgi:hypothetical protein
MVIERLVCIVPHLTRNLSVIKMPFAKRVRRLCAGSVGRQMPFNYIKSD